MEDSINKMTGKMDLMLEKIDCLQKSSTKVQVDIAGIKQHLKNLNGKIDRHESELKENSKDIGKLKGVVRYFTGIGTTLVLLFTFFGEKIRRIFMG